MGALILGGAGFIGTALVELLYEKHGDSVHVVDNLLMGNQFEYRPASHGVELKVASAENPLVVREALDARPNVIYHLAANSDIAKSALDPEIDVRNTFSTTAALAIELAKSPDPAATVIFSSTSAVYGAQEVAIDKSTIKAPASAYGWMKLASEALLSTLLESGSIGKLVIVRFPNVTGRGQTHGVVKDLVSKYLSADAWTVLGDGTQNKPYLHVDDLVSVLARLDEIFPTPGFHELNLAPNSSTKVSEIVGMIEERGGRKRVALFGSSPQGWPGDVPSYSYDTTELNRLGIDLPPSELAVRRSVDEEFRKHGY